MWLLFKTYAHIVFDYFELLLFVFGIVSAARFNNYGRPA